MFNIQNYKALGLRSLALVNCITFINWLIMKVSMYIIDNGFIII